MSLIRARYRAVNTIMNLPRGGGYVGLLDLYPNAAAAYSLRKLRAAYSGSAVRVRKEVSSVSSETDIGFAADGSLDTVSLLAFASDADGGDVSSVNVLDQSQNTNTASNSTAANQPQIVSSGSIVTENTKPALNFAGSSALNLSSSLTLDSFSWFFVLKMNLASPSSFEGLLGDSSSVNSRLRMLASTSLEIAINGSSDTSGSVAVQTQIILSIIRVGTTLNWWVNGVSIGTESVSSSAFILNQIGTYNDVNYGDWTIQELIVYASDQSANRTAIESNQATFYGITL